MKPTTSKISETGTTFGVSCSGDIKPLLMCLSSVLMGISLPKKITVLFSGEFPTFDCFYFAQISALARLKGVEFHIAFGEKGGVREVRDWHLNNCTTPYLWMGDSDVVYDSFCLYWLEDAMDARNGAFVVGCKGDVNNRRGYPDFKIEKQPYSAIQENCSFNHFYDMEGENCSISVPSLTLDTGNVLFSMKLVRENKWKFKLFDKSYNCGGEDTLFAMQIYRDKHHGYFAAGAIAYHMEKAASNFTEFAARGEMLALACDKLGVDRAFLDSFMPFQMPS